MKVLGRDHHRNPDKKYFFSFKFKNILFLSIKSTKAN